MKLTQTLLICLLSLNLFGQSIATDRPDQTESALTVEAGALQLESGIGVSFVGIETFRGDLVQRDILIPTNLIRYGIIDIIELRLVQEVNQSRLGGENSFGMNDLQLGTKISLFSADSGNLDIAILSHAVFPTGTETFRAGQFGSITKFALSHPLSDAVGMGYNVGFDYFGENTETVNYSVSLAVSVSEQLGIYVEPFGNYNIATEQFEQSADAGFTWLFNPLLQFDFSFGSGLNHNMNYAAVGLSWKVLRK